MHFASPWALLALLVIPVIFFVERYRRPGGGLHFSSVDQPLQAGRSLRQRLVRLPLLIRVMVLILLALALARPQEGREKIYDINHGIAIEMVVDRSGSMGAEMKFDGRRLNRLEAVKDVFAEFVNGNKKGLSGRPSDLIGLIAFARYPDTLCPLTLAHGALSGFLDNVRLVTRKNEDGTAIGDALALAAARLKTAEEDLARQREDKKTRYKIKSKIIILLTDGGNNAGKRTPQEAAALAREWGIKIYAIGVGDGDGTIKVQTPFGPQMLRMGQGVDKKTLAGLADTTGGVFRMAEDGEALRAIYQEIDRLEKSEVKSVVYVDYKELFPWFTIAALVLLTLEVLLRTTVFRRIP